MRKAFASLFVLSLVVAAAPVFAADTDTVDRPSVAARPANFLGTVGIFRAPSAYTPGDRVVSAFVGGTHDFVGGGVTGGIGNRLEVGVNAIGLNDGPTLVSPEAKFQLLREKHDIPAFSVGVIDPFDQSGRGASWYLVATKDLGNMVSKDFDLRVHLGYGAGLYGDTVFAAGELFFTKNLSAAAEYADRDVNVGARYYYKGWTASVVLFDLSNFGGQLTYNFHFK
jgi:hypothetical protein